MIVIKSYLEGLKEFIKPFQEQADNDYKCYIESLMQEVIQYNNEYAAFTPKDKANCICRFGYILSELMNNESEYIDIVDKDTIKKYVETVKEILKDLYVDIDYHLDALLLQKAKPNLEKMTKKELIDYIKEKEI